MLDPRCVTFCKTATNCLLSQRPHSHNHSEAIYVLLCSSPSPTELWQLGVLVLPRQGPLSLYYFLIGTWSICNALTSWLYLIMQPVILLKCAHFFVVHTCATRIVRINRNHITWGHNWTLLYDWSKTACAWCHRNQSLFYPLDHTFGCLVMPITSHFQ